MSYFADGDIPCVGNSLYKMGIITQQTQQPTIVKKEKHKKLNKKMDLVLEKMENLDKYEAIQRDITKFIRVLGEDIHRIETSSIRKDKVQKEVDNKTIEKYSELIQDLTLLMEEPGRYSDAGK